MIVAYFDYNNKKYIIYIENDEVKFGFKDGNVINNNLNVMEKQLVGSIYNRITISKNKDNYKKCGTIKLNDKEFQIYYDNLSKLKTFFEINDEEFKAPTYSEYISLDAMLNPTVYYSNRLLKKASILGLTITLSMSGCHKLNYNNIKSPDRIEYNYTTATYSYDELKQSLNSNKNITKEEKQYILEHCFKVVEENIEYMDTPMAYQRLNDFKINYKNEIVEGISGTYTPSTNTIDIYNATSFEEFIVNDKDGIFFHEFVHLICSKDISLGHGLNEAITEIISNEYGREDLSVFNNTYSKERTFSYLLIELLNPEIIKQYYFMCDPEILINHLNNYIHHTDMAYELLGIIDNLEIEIMENPYDIDNPIYRSVAYNYIYMLDEVFNAKYGISALEDPIMKEYIFQLYPFNDLCNSSCLEQLDKCISDKTKGLNKEEYYTLLNTCDLKYDMQPLAYFSKEYISEKYNGDIPKVLSNMNLKIGSEEYNFEESVDKIERNLKDYK